ncbi:MAG TPA: winged helix-turn-helix domain-containing protein [Vicinamibacterales bacterium]|nr:winged helix-turn-helix domain-containing protein [Vicinamibacterales bacterium]
MPASGLDETADSRQVVRFGVFELDVRASELRKQGVKLKLQGKPLQLLIALVRRPGSVVTRDELRRQLWASDVFVDFDSSLNTAINRLRFVLGDSAETPRYVETLARTGYRFIAPIEIAVPRGAAAERAPNRRGARVAAIVLAPVLLVLVVATLVAFRTSRPSDFRFKQVTFRRGQVWGARFAPDGEGILYTANWDNGPRQLFLTSPTSPESRALGFEELRLVAVSRTGELALMAFDGTMPITGGTLSRVPMNGGAPKVIERNIMAADWAQQNDQLALVRAVEGANQLEFPPGTVIHKTSGWMSGVRVSPRGERLAFIEHPVRHDNRGTLKVIEPGRAARALTREWANAGGIAWHPQTSDIWFTASPDGSPKSLWKVTLGGDLRQVASIAGTMTLRDIAPDGRTLASRDTQQLEMAAFIEGESAQRNLTWLDWSRVADISPNGRMVLFDESGVAGGSQYTVYLHRLDDGSTVRVGPGVAMAFSPDGRAVLTGDTENRTRLRLFPLGDGKQQELPLSGLEYQWARYFPDGKSLLALASEPGGPLRLYVQPIGGRPAALTPPGTVRNTAISPDGTQVAIFSADGKLMVYRVDRPGGAGRVVATREPLAPLLWTADDSLIVQHVGAYTQIPTRISRLELASGTLEPLRDVGPADLLGVNAITKVMVSSNQRTIVFNYRRVLSELFVAELGAR